MHDDRDQVVEAVEAARAGSYQRVALAQLGGLLELEPRCVLPHLGLERSDEGWDLLGRHELGAAGRFMAKGEIGEGGKRLGQSPVAVEAHDEPNEGVEL